jgi:type III secretion system FlhB-like substrate exporter
VQGGTYISPRLSLFCVPFSSRPAPAAAPGWSGGRMTGMNRTDKQKGEGRVGFIIALIIVAVVVFLGIKIVPVRISAYEFRDTLREEARYAAVRNDDAKVAKRIMEKAQELEIPLKRDQLKIRRTTGEMIITAYYNQPIDLKVTTYVYKFKAKEKAPLF